MSDQVYDASLDAKMEDRSEVESVRDDSNIIHVNGRSVGKIKSYKFKILVHNKPSLEGELSREQMDLIYRLYSSEGANLNRRDVSRYFPNYTFQEFKKILLAYNITKSCSPMAPHTLEERTVEELIELTLHNKENDFLKKLEQDRNRKTESRLRDVIKENFELKQSIDNFCDFLDSIKLEYKIIPVKSKLSNNRTLLVYLSDMHIGADVSSYSIYSNDFHLKTINERMNLVYNRILDLATLTLATNVVICNIGDSLDGYNGETTRGGHLLPQNMNNKDQYKNYLQVMLNLFSNLSTCGKFNKIKYFCVESGNHDGDFGWMVNKSLEGCLSYLNPEIDVKIFEKFIDNFVIDNTTYVLCHGKDQKDMFKNLPLTLNEKTENQINEYLDYNNITGNVKFIKGDLHQSATTFGKKFEYRSVGSFFGSSEWIHKNFGNTKACVDFDIAIGDIILNDRLILN